MDKKFNIMIADLYRENQYKLYIHALNLINDEENAKDIVNDVFCSVLENEKIKNSGPEILPLLFDSKALFSPDSYSADEYLKDVFNAVWRPLDNKDERINYFTRQLERIYLAYIKSMLCPSKTDKEDTSLRRSDAILYVESHLDDIEAYIENRLKEYTSEDDINHRHFASLKREVNDIKKEYYLSKSKYSFPRHYRADALLNKLIINLSLINSMIQSIYNCFFLYFCPIFSS